MKRIITLIIVLIVGIINLTAKERILTGKVGGKYQITVVIDLDKTGPVSGTYWYGSGKNGKMKLKGTIDFLGRINLTEYDPNGKKTGDWYINITNEKNNKYGITGIMMNKKDQVFNINCIEK